MTYRHPRPRHPSKGLGASRRSTPSRYLHPSGQRTAPTRSPSADHRPLPPGAVLPREINAGAPGNDAGDVRLVPRLPLIDLERLVPRADGTPAALRSAA